MTDLRPRGEAANTAVCKTAIRGCKSHHRLMKLIFIYGPPAVGKLTIAKVLAERIDFKLFHNHLSYDLGREIFSFTDTRLWSLVEKLRIDVIAFAAKQEDIKGMIFTFCYTPSEAEFTKNVVDTIKRAGV